MTSPEHGPDLEQHASVPTGHETARPFHRRMLDAYSGEHGVYGVVLVTALIAVGVDKDSDWDVLEFVVGTVVVFWLAHIYASIVASRASDPHRKLGAAFAAGARHSIGMVISMLIPALLLSLASFGFIEEWTAYWIALWSGVIVLAVIGYANAARNRSPWSLRILGTLSTTGLGLLVILLSIIVH